MAKVRLEHISKIYPASEKKKKYNLKVTNEGVLAVDDFNLEINDKEFVVLVGPSGCGKSTTLRMIAGLEEISKGSLYIDDKLVNNVEPKDRDIAMVFQNYALYPHMSVYENMSFGLRLRKVPKDEIDKKVKEAAEILGITQYLDRKPKALSGGQRQRVAIGRAIVRNPKVFLMDEPLSNLDAKLRSQMRIEIQKIYKNLGTTVIYVTHDQTEAMTLGTKIVVMKDGVVQQVDTPQNLYEKPKNKFVAGFIGSPTINMIDGEISEKNNKLIIKIDNYEFEIPNEKGKLLKDKGYVGKKVTLGIRPEHIKGYEYFLEKDENYVINANITFRELLGAEVYLYFNIGDTQFISRESATLKGNSGDTIKLAIEPDKMMFFDKETENNIIEN